MSRATDRSRRELGRLVLPPWLWIPLREWMEPGGALEGVTAIGRETRSAPLRVAINDPRALARFLSATLAVGELEQKAGDISMFWSRVPEAMRTELEQIPRNKTLEGRAGFGALLAGRRAKTMKSTRHWSGSGWGLDRSETSL